ncbi:MAG: hypothetical protein ACQET5_06995 [Halobacteriota archaeon]|uniref:hypothetical protein n=1 Tax=Natronomonas sp. TaxID=2184060 RepID=UPI0039752368
MLRFAFAPVGLISVLDVLTQRYVGLLFSLDIVGIARTSALRQPLFSLIEWIYIVIDRTYEVGDRVGIEGAKRGAVGENINRLGVESRYGCSRSARSVRHNRGT